MAHASPAPARRWLPLTGLVAVLVGLAFTWSGPDTPPDQVVGPAPGPSAVPTTGPVTTPTVATKATADVPAVAAAVPAEAVGDDTLRIENIGGLGLAARPVVAGEAMVRLGAADVDAVVATLEAHGLAVIEYAAPIDAMRVALPAGWSVADGVDYIQRLDTPELDGVTPMANAVAWAASGHDPEPWQWTAEDAQMAAEAEARENSPAGLQRRGTVAAAAANFPVVAVIDTGINCYSKLLPRGPFVTTYAFRHIDCRAGWNFVHDDGHALDDNVHGSHVAATALGAAGNRARLMPVKVLDWQARGTEFDVAQGIAHAAEHGAHIINLSLTFGGGYVPSPLMIDAIDAAIEREVIVVGASGNTASPMVAYPAAFEAVVAVGSIVDAETPAPYSNTGSALDLVAFGGGLPSNQNGVAAEAFEPHRPTHLGQYRMSGTSVAAGIVSGQLAAVLADAGLDSTAAARLAALSTPTELAGAFSPELGLGLLDPENAVRSIQDARDELLQRELGKAAEQPAVYPVVLIEEIDAHVVRGVAVIEVIDEARQPLPGAVVHGDWLGSAPGEAVCVTDDFGRCVVETDQVEPGAASPLFGLIVHRVVTHEGAVRVLPGSRLDGTGAARLNDAMVTLRLHLPAAQQTKADLGILQQIDPDSGEPAYCRAMDCPGTVPAGAHPEDIFAVQWTPLLTVSRFEGGVPAADSLLAGRNLAETYVARRLGRAFEGSGLSLAFDQDFYDGLSALYGDTVYLDDEGLQLGTGDGDDPLLWINDWDVATLADGVGMMISGFRFGGRSFGAAAMFYEAQAEGVGMMISGFMVGVFDRQTFMELGQQDYGIEWPGFGVGMMISGFSPNPLFDLPYYGTPQLPGLPDDDFVVPTFP